MKKLFTFIAFFCVLTYAHGQYPRIRIADVTVTSENQDSITSSYITGTVRYDSASRTLILQNATINRYDSGDPYDGSNGNTLSIEAHSGQTVNIELIGHNAVLGKNALVLGSGSYNIVGSGSLNLYGVLSGVDCDLGVASFHIGSGASVIIDVPYTPATGFQGSAQYQNYDRTVLSIDSGTLIVNADYCIRSIEGLQLNGSHIVTPDGAYYDPESRAMVTSDGIVRNYLAIRPDSYDVDVPQYLANDGKPSVYPNPTDDILHIELSGAGIAHVALYDLQGRMVYSQNPSNSPTISHHPSNSPTISHHPSNSPTDYSPTATMDIRNLPAGMYVLRVTDADGHEYHRKIVKR